MNIRQQTQQRLGIIRDMNKKITERTDEEIIDCPVNYFPHWQEFETLKRGQVVQYDNIKYLALVDIKEVVETPNDNVLYRPYRDSNVYEWLKNEYIEQGWVRTITNKDMEEVRYIATDKIGDNLDTPESKNIEWELEPIVEFAIDDDFIIEDLENLE